MNCNPQSLPKDWDSGLEELLKAPLCSAVRLSNIPWNEQTLDKIMDTKTFIEAINVTPPQEKSVICTVNPLVTRTKRISHLINAPLSPRKPIIIPCSHRTVKQRDKQHIEKIFRQRNRLLNPQTLNQSSDDEKKNINNQPTNGSQSKLPQLSVKSNDESVSNRSATSLVKSIARPFPITNLRHSSLQQRYKILYNV
ncbi:hypothetical protein M9Y10_023412 [Tritrichomonas musculus]|uniref:Uncharacterized protein n=1 Tax=Tritrichomonas musculus TaxID=1915356 RepID=A0ABR2KV11_9EUKA